MKNEPRLKPEQSCVMMRSMEEVLLSPVGDDDMGSRMDDVGGWVMLRGFHSLMSR